MKFCQGTLFFATEPLATLIVRVCEELSFPLWLKKDQLFLLLLSLSLSYDLVWGWSLEYLFSVMEYLLETNFRNSANLSGRENWLVSDSRELGT